jgi:hypothetical protein
MRMADKARRAEEVNAEFAVTLQAHENAQLQKLDRAISPLSDATDISELDKAEEEKIQNLHAATPSQRSSSTVSKRERAGSSHLTSRSSSNVRVWDPVRPPGLNSSVKSLQ